MPLGVISVGSLPALNLRVIKGFSLERLDEGGHDQVLGNAAERATLNEAPCGNPRLTQATMYNARSSVHDDRLFLVYHHRPTAESTACP